MKNTNEGRLELALKNEAQPIACHLRDFSTFRTTYFAPCSMLGDDRIVAVTALFGGREFTMSAHYQRIERSAEGVGLVAWQEDYSARIPVSFSGQESEDITTTIAGMLADYHGAQIEEVFSPSDVTDHIPWVNLFRAAAGWMPISNDEVFQIQRRSAEHYVASEERLGLWGQLEEFVDTVRKIYDKKREGKDHVDWSKMPDQKEINANLRRYENKISRLKFNLLPYLSESERKCLWARIRAIEETCPYEFPHRQEEYMRLRQEGEAPRERRNSN